MEKIDLHIHTTCSDGVLNPYEVIDEAYKNDVKIISITDHDTISAYTEDLIEQIRIDYMRGIKPTELSVKYNINRGTIYGIVNNTRWKHVNPNGWEDFLKDKRNKITTNK